MTKLRIGLDLDNTIIRYDDVFRGLALARAWIGSEFPASKTSLKELLIKQDGGDLRWQELQAQAYGPRLLDAKAFPGCLPFIARALRDGHELFIVSHKSETSHLRSDVRLREQALRWLEENAPELKPENVFFTSTRDEKISVIGSLELDFFIDDLEEVLEHPAFPSRTQRVHFTGPDWAGIATIIETAGLIGVPAYRAIVSTFGRAPVRALPAAKGGNNRTLKVLLDGGEAVALKRYWVDGRDRRTRAGTEHRALRLMWDAGLRRIPEPFFLDPRGEFALMGWLDGKPLAPSEIGPGHIQQAVDFLHRLAELHRSLQDSGYPEGADSRRRLSDYPAIIEKRLAAILRGVELLPDNGAFKEFLIEDLAPLKESLTARFFEKARAGDADIEALFPGAERTLSPSDFGFHNALLGADGRLFFLDFEYFGVDDPAKLAADFTHSVAQTVPSPFKRLFVERLAAGLERPESFRTRLALVDDLIALEWVLIVLNVLSPESLARRGFSDPGQDERALLSARLAKARELVEELRTAPKPELVETMP